MPVSAGTVQFSYVGDGTTTVFAFPSRFLSNADIIVGVNGVPVLSGFVVTGQGNATGGNVTFAVAPLNGQTVTLIRAPGISQLLDFVNNQTILAENLDNGLDKLTIIAQYLGYLLDRTLRLSQFDTAISGNFDLLGKRISNSGAPVNANDLARLADLQAVVSASGNVPSPTVGQIGYRLQALAAGIFGWVAAGSTSAPDGSLSAPGVNFASEPNTGLLRPSAGLLQTSVLGGLCTELSSTALRLLVSLLSTNGTVTGGTNAQGQGAITTDQATVTSTPNNPSGVTLPTAVAGRRITVVNRGTNPISIYPATGAQIGALAVNLPVTLAVGQVAEFFARTATQWENQISQPLDAALTSLAGLSLSTGDLLFATAADTLARLAAGASPEQALYMKADLTGPEWSTAFRVRAWANFSASQTNGTYSRTGNLVTVTMAGHGMITGHSVRLDFTTGTATDGWYAITVLGANTFTVTDSASGTTSGNVSRSIWLRASGNVSSIERTGTATYRINMASALADANFAVTGSVVGSSSANFGNLAYISSSTELPTTSSFGIRCGRDDGSPVDVEYIHVMVVR